MARFVGDDRDCHSCQLSCQCTCGCTYALVHREIGAPYRGDWYFSTLSTRPAMTTVNLSLLINVSRSLVTPRPSQHPGTGNRGVEHRVDPEAAALPLGIPTARLRFPVGPGNGTLPFFLRPGWMMIGSLAPHTGHDALQHVTIQRMTDVCQRFHDRCARIAMPLNRECIFWVDIVSRVSSGQTGPILSHPPGRHPSARPGPTSIWRHGRGQDWSLSPAATYPATSFGTMVRLMP